MASNTRRAGASNRRVRTISRSEGVVTLKVSLFAARTAGMSLLLRFQVLQVHLELVEASLPDVAIALRPLGDLLERARLDPAGPPLGLAALGDEARALQHAQVLGDAGQAHVERLRQLRDRALALGQARQDGPPGGIGEGGERGAEGVGRHELFYRSVN